MMHLRFFLERLMNYADTSEILLRGIRAVLDAWRLGGPPDDVLYWVLRLTGARSGLLPGEPSAIEQEIPVAVAPAVQQARLDSETYWADIRYASLAPVTQLWGTVVNTLRVVGDSDRSTPLQKRIFAHPPESLVHFFLLARERMEIADELYHAFRAMPAPECQALAALLNVHVDAPLDATTLRRVVRLIDHEGPMSPDELDALEALTQTSLVSASFRGLRYNA